MIFGYLYKLNKFWLMIIFSMCFIASLSAYIYVKQRVISPLRNEKELVVIKASNEPFRVRPSDPGGYKPANMDKTIYENFEKNSKLAENKLAKNERILAQPDQPIDKQKILENYVKSANKQSEANDNELKISNKSTEYQQFIEEKLEASYQESAKNIDKKQAAIATSIVKADQKKHEINEIVAQTNKEAKSAYKIQLASFKNYNDTKSLMDRVNSQYKELLGSYSPYIEKKDIVNKGVFYRLQFRGFASLSAARSACNKLLEANLGCLVIKEN